MTLDPYDFRSPAPLTNEVTRRLDAWFAEAARRSAKSWAKILTSSPELRPKAHEVVQYEECPAYLAGEALCFRVARGAGGPASMVSLPRTLMLVLLGSALGETVVTVPTDRALTSVEESLGEYLVRVLLLDEFRGAWPGPQPLTLEVGKREADPRAALPFAPDDGVLACTFSVVGAFGTIDWCWLLPRSGWLDDAPAPADRAAADPGANPAVPPLEALARSMPVDLVVLLGTAELALTQVEQLQAGDLILLDQEVNQPLKALVSGATKFHVSPGAAGSRLAVRVQSMVTA
jgi:flagellar motor switch protein FliM